LREVINLAISPELKEMLDALPNSSDAHYKKEPTGEQIAILKLYWKKKDQRKVSEIMGVCRNTCRRWYKEYVEWK